MIERQTLTRYAWLSIGTAAATICLKLSAWWLTGSIGMLADAMESLTNLVTAGMALLVLTIAARPADEDHAYGHGKAEYFAGALEGILIMLAAAGIGWTAVQRLFTPNHSNKRLPVCLLLGWRPQSTELSHSSSYEPGGATIRSRLKLTVNTC